MRNAEKITTAIIEVITLDNDLQLLSNYKQLKKKYEPIIKEKVENFLELNPSFEFDNSMLELLGAGDEDESNKLFKSLPGYEELEKSLGDFFQEE